MRQIFLLVLIFLSFFSVQAASEFPSVDSLSHVIDQTSGDEEKLMAYYNAIDALYWSGDTLGGDHFLTEMEDFSKAKYPDACQGLMDIMFGIRLLISGKGLARSLDRTLSGINFIQASGQYSKSTVEILAAGYDLAGYTFQMGGAFDLALDHYKKAEKLAETFGFIELLRVVYNNLSDLYSSDFNDRTRGLAYLKSALRIAEENHQVRSLGMLNSNLGVFYNADNQHELAKTHLLKSVGYFQEINDKEGLGHAYHELAMLTLELDELETAGAYADLSLEMVGDDCFWCMYLQYTLGDILWEEKKFAQAKERIEMGRRLAEKFGDASGELEGIVLEAELEYFLGNWENASKLYKDGLQMKDSLQGIWKVDKVAEVQSASELSQMVQEKRTLKVENDQLDAQVDFQGKILALTIALLLITVTSGLVIYTSRRRLRESHRTLVRKNRLLVAESMRRDIFPSKTEVAISPKEHPDPVESPSTVDTDLNQAEEMLAKRIRSMFEQEEVYLDNELSLAALAEKLDTNTSYLSKVINQTYGKGFRRVVNEYRIQRVLDSFERGEFRTLTIFAIAQQAGFKSKSSFNSAFYQYTGVTPTFYIKNMQE